MSKAFGITRPLEKSEVTATSRCFQGATSPVQSRIATVHGIRIRPTWTEWPQQDDRRPDARIGLQGGSLEDQRPYSSWLRDVRSQSVTAKVAHIPL